MSRSLLFTVLIFSSSLTLARSNLSLDGASFAPEARLHRLAVIQLQTGVNTSELANLLTNSSVNSVDTKIGEDSQVVSNAAGVRGKYRSFDIISKTQICTVVIFVRESTNHRGKLIYQASDLISDQNFNVNTAMREGCRKICKTDDKVCVQKVSY